MKKKSKNVTVVCPSCVHEFAVNDSNKDAQIAALTSRLAEAEAALEKERERYSQAHADGADAIIASFSHVDLRGRICELESSLAAAVARAERADAAQHYHRQQPVTVQFPIRLTRPALSALLELYRQNAGHTLAGSAGAIRAEWRAGRKG